MSIEQSAERRRAIQAQRGRKTQNLGGTLQRFWAVAQRGPKWHSALEPRWLSPAL